MKANGAKRKIFNDAMDLLNGAGEMPAPEGGIQMLPIDSIRPFRNHPFRLYEGERLDDMVDSIREYGILNPVIVWQDGDEYEMLAGHNRQNAGKLVGLTEIPAIVKTELTEADAYVYVIETNVIQRGFAELLPSEKAAVLAERYEKVSNQGKRNDILEEIEKLSGTDTAETCGHDVHKSKSRDALGEECGMTGRNIARYIRVNQLEQPLKERLDNGTLPLVAAVDLSYLSAKEQETVAGLAGQGKIKLDVKTAKCLKGMVGEVTEKRVLERVENGKGKKAAPGRSIKLSSDVYEKYFADVKAGDVAGIVEKALAAWFEREGMSDVS
ncbi:ParB N-terminal domain-containing protein [Lactonifactor longoviformis]|uniref:ParB N-terminal domain-containing protein n=1 Tax=Lactonifactor longoviformis TaxID=341220 RepID=UPI0036F23EC3